MMWRHLCLARALAASGVLSCTLIGSGSTRAGEPGEPVPAADSAVETVDVLKAEQAGLLDVEVRGAGQESVRVQLKNRSGRKLRIVLPPGLVASNATGQGPGGGGGGGGGGGFQNMGLGAAGNQAGGFGQFAGRSGGTGFRSVPVEAEVAAGAVAVPADQAVDFAIPAVCLNFGAPTPTSKARFKLVDVDTYSADARVRKSLRALATLGTSHGVAQAAMWRVCNDVSFEEMLAKGEKLINPAEVALAARFVRSIDAGTDPAAELDTPRVFVSIAGDADVAQDVARLGRELNGLRILGLPVRVVARGEVPRGAAPVVHLGVTLGTGDSRETRGRIVVQAGEGIDTLDWTTLGTARFDELSNVGSLDAATLARAIDHAVGSTFVTARVAKRSAHGTTVEIRNRLPFTVASVTVKAGSSPNAPLVDVAAIGIGPNRSGLATVAASNATVEQVELNGL